MISTQALILKTFPQDDYRALLLDEKHGKVYAQLGAALKVQLCQGMLIQGNLYATKRASAYSLKNIDPIYAPFDQACHDIEFLHTFLFVLHATIPMHAHFSGIFAYTQYVYTIFSQLDSHQKKLVLLFIFLKGGIFPEDPWLYKLVLEQAFLVHKTFLDERTQQKASQAFLYCWQFVSADKNLYLYR